MHEGPPVTVRDPRRPAAPHEPPVDGGSADLVDGGPSPSRSRRTLVGVLLVGCVVGCVAGFVAGRAVDGPDGADLPSPLVLVLVADRDVDVRGQPGVPPRGEVQLLLVNTGLERLRLLGGRISDSGLTWMADRPLEPGEQLTAVLVDRSPCSTSAGRRPAGRATMAVDVLQDGERRRLELPVPAELLRDYENKAGAACRRPRTSEALSMALAGGPVGPGPALQVPITLQNRAIQPVQLHTVEATLDGTSATVRTRDGSEVPLPLTLPGRSVPQREQDLSTPPESSPYLLAVTADRDACEALRARGGETVTVSLRYGYAGEPLDTAETFFALSLARLMLHACGPA